MVAIVGGKDVGLSNGSAAVLGQQGSFGNAVHGSTKESVYVNVVNGNLTLQDRDDFVASRGIDIALTRTYNSAATLNDGIGANWKNGQAKQIVVAPGVVPNSSGSSVIRLDGDGSAALYLYDDKLKSYVSTDGGGGYRFLSYAAGKWTWTSDRSGDAPGAPMGLYEVYDDKVAGRIVQSGDQFGVRLSYLYGADGTLAQITDATNKDPAAAGNGGAASKVNDQIQYSYVNGNLAKVTTLLGDSGGKSSSIVSYEYDGQNRLVRVTADLLPDGKITDGAVHVTEYSYGDANPNYITGIKQSDGSRLAFEYAGGKITSFSVYGSGDADCRKTTLNYAGNVTTVTDALNNKTDYSYDAAGQLVAVSSLANGGGRQEFEYDTAGNLLSSTDPRGLKTVYTYAVQTGTGKDNWVSQGNWISKRDSAGNRVERSYAPGSDKLLGETVFLPAEPATNKAEQRLVTRYAYDAGNRLRYTVTPEGRVTRFTYAAPTAAKPKSFPTEVLAERRYVADFFSGGGSDNELLASLDAWAAKVPGGNVSDTSYTYNERGLLSGTSRSANNGSENAVSSTSFVYDYAGLLKQSSDGNGVTTSYDYDGLGRMTKKVVGKGGAVLSTTSNTYSNLSNGTQMIITVTDGAATTSVFNRAGELVSLLQPASAGTSRNYYDANGRLRLNISAGGQSTAWLYDQAGRKTAEIDADGSLTEFAYNADNQLTQTKRYARAISKEDLLACGVLRGDKSLGDNPLIEHVELGERLRNAGGAFRSSWNIYDAAGRLSDSVDANGQVTHLDYDGASRAIKITQRARAVKLAGLDGNNPQLAAQDPADDDRVARKFYDNDGMLVGQVDALGYLTENRYNGAGLLIETVAYGVASPLGSSRDIGDWRPAAAPQDIHQYFYYDAKDQLVASVDGDNYLTEKLFDKVGNVISRIRYANPLAAPAQANLAALKADKRNAAAFAVNTATRCTVYTYTALNQLKSEQDFGQLATNPQGLFGNPGNLTSYTYNRGGQVETITHTLGTVVADSSVRNYDTRGHLLSQAESASAKATVYTYDDDGLRTSQTDPNGNKTFYYYDADGRLSHTVDPLGAVQEQRYNAFGQVVLSRQYATTIATAGLSGGRNVEQLAALRATPVANASLRYYDAAGRLRYTVDAAGGVSRQDYTAFNEVAGTLRYAGMLAGADVLALRGDADEVAAGPGGGTAGGRLAAIIAGSGDGQLSQFVYDANGRLTYSINGQGEAKGNEYDAFGRVAASRSYAARAVGAAPAASALDSVQRYAYDERGHVVDYTDAGGNLLETDYNAFGEVVQRRQHFVVASTAADARDAVSRTLYDEDGQVLATIDGTGALAVFRYDGSGRVVERTAYATRLTAKKIADITADNIATQLSVDAAHDAHQRYYYDGRGRLSITLTAQLGQLAGTSGAKGTPQQWSVSTQAYDENGNVTERVGFAKNFSDNDGTAVSAPAAFDKAVADWVAGANGAAKNASASDSVVRIAYDPAGRQIATATAQRRAVDKVGGVWSLVSYDYDAGGRLLERTAYATALNAANPADGLKALAERATRPYHPADAVTRYSYDGLGRVLTTAVASQPQADGAGPVPGGSFMIAWSFSSQTYDAAGNITLKTQYAAPAWSRSDERVPSAPVADAAHDRSTWFIYDQANRLIGTRNAVGDVAGLAYDAKGNAVRSSTGSGNDERVSRTVYDLAGRPVLSIDAVGGVTERRYDGLGNVVATVRYAMPFDAAALPLDVSAKSVLAALAGANADNRIERSVYDQDGRPVFVVDAAGYFKELRYDALGRLIGTLEYAEPIAAGDAEPGALLAAAVKAQNDKKIAPRSNQFDYDAQGNLVKSTDALNHAETFSFDALGRKTAFTNKLKKVWDYEYDAAGRLLKETGPALDVYLGALPDNREEAAKPPQKNAQVRLVTALRYDALGNLVARTEAQGIQSRETRYVYDTVGRQVRTLLPPAMVGAATRDDLFVEVVYDYFGNAIANKDAAGQWSYKFYDKLGRVSFELDAARYLTGYSRDAFGAVTTLTRYAAVQPATLDLPGNPDLMTVTPGSIIVTPGEDRCIATKYDRLGRVVRQSEAMVELYDPNGLDGQTELSASKTTDTEYNAFGEARLVSVYGMGQPKGGGGAAMLTHAATTRYYYDTRGNKRAQVVALLDDRSGKQGYLTTYRYDEVGNLSNQIEYATLYGNWSDDAPGKPAASKQDRSTTWTYDSANRKTSEVRDHAYFATVADAANPASTGSDLVTGYLYDDLGNTTQTNAMGALSATYYDAMGRATAVVATKPSAAGQPVSLAAMTEFQLDAFGNVVKRTDYATGVKYTAATNNAGVAAQRPTPLADTATSKDRSSQTSYDLSGRALQLVDAEGKVVNNAYDELGRVVRQWRTVTGAGGETAVLFQRNYYDVLGRVERIDKPGNVDLTKAPGALPPDTIEERVYNAFGEQIFATVRGADQAALDTTAIDLGRWDERWDRYGLQYTRYDQAGRAWLSNVGDGVDKASLFDAQGNVTAQIRSTSAVRHTFSGLASAAAARAASGEVLRTESRYDMMGRTVDSGRIAHPNLTVLSRVDGQWRTQTQPAGTAANDSMIVVAGPLDAANEFSLKYSSDGGKTWTAGSSNRLFKLDGYTIFNTAGMLRGDYVFKVYMTPAAMLSGAPGKEAGYEIDGGKLAITSDTSAKKTELLALLYRVLRNRDIDMQSNNQLIDRLNSGTTLGQLAFDMMNENPALGGKSAVEIVGAILNDALGIARSNEPGYQATVAQWSVPLAAASGSQVAQGQVIIDFLDANRQANTNQVGDKVVLALARLERSAALAAAKATQDAANAAAAATPMEEAYRMVSGLYVALFERAPDSGGLKGWAGKYLQGLYSMEQIANLMLADQEGARLAVLSNADFLRVIYASVLGRTEPDSMPFWQAQLDGGASRGRVVLNIVDSLQHSALSLDADLKAQKLFNNKAAVGVLYALDMGGTDLATGKTLLGYVTDSDIGGAVAYATQVAGDLARQNALRLQPDAEIARKLAMDAKLAADAWSSAAAALDAVNEEVRRDPLATSTLLAARLYVGLLNRGEQRVPLDIGGLSGWLDKLKAGGSEVAIAQQMIETTEGRNVFPPVAKWDANAAATFVATLYRQILGREPDNGGSYWVQFATSADKRGEVATAFMHSVLDNKLALDNMQRPFEERLVGAFHQKVGQALAALARSATQASAENGAALAAAIKASNLAAAATAAANQLNASVNAVSAASTKATTEVVRLYVGILNRGLEPRLPLDLGGLTGWVKDRLNGASLNFIAERMLSSDEGRARFPAGMAPRAFVSQLYLQSFNRPLQDGDNFWTNQFPANASSAKKAELANAILSSLYDNMTSNPAEMGNKAERDQYMADALMRLPSLAQLARGTTAATLLDAMATRDATARAYPAAVAANEQAQAEFNNPSSNPAIAAAMLAKKNVDDTIKSQKRYELIQLMVAFNIKPSISLVQNTLAELGSGRLTFTALAASYAGPMGDRGTFFTHLYQVVLHRTPAPGEIDYLLNDPRSDAGVFAYTLFNDAILNEFKAAGAVRASYGAELEAALDANNKEGAAIYYAADAKIQSLTKALADNRNAAAAAVPVALEAREAAAAAYLNRSMAMAIVTQRDRVDATNSTLVSLEAAAASRKAYDEIMLANRLAEGNSVEALSKAIERIAVVAKSAELDARLETRLKAMADAGAEVVRNLQTLKSATAGANAITEITRIYTAVLGRAPTLTELSLGFDASAKAGWRAELAQVLIDYSPELYPAGMGNDEFVRQTYLFALGRSGGEEGRGFWTKQLGGAAPRTRGQIVCDIVDSVVEQITGPDSISFHQRIAERLGTLAAALAAEVANPDVGEYLRGLALIARNAAVKADAAVASLGAEAGYATEITQLYVLLASHAPDAGGLRYWIRLRAGGSSMAEVAGQMLEQDSAAMRALAAMGDQDFVGAMLDMAFDTRAADADAAATRPFYLRSAALLAQYRDGYAAQLQGGATRGQVAAALIHDLLGYTGGDALQLGSRITFMGDVALALREVAADAALQLGALNGQALDLGALVGRRVAELAANGLRLGVDNRASGVRTGVSPSRITLDRWGNMVAVGDVRDPNWKMVYRYNHDNQLIDQTVNALAGTEATAKHASTDYDQLGRVVATTDAMGNVNRTEYDASGAVWRETHADGGVVNYANDMFGQHGSMTVRRNNAGYAGGETLVTTYVYDRMGRQVSRSGALVDVYYTATEPGRPVGTDPGYTYLASGKGKITQRSVYDELGRLIRSENSNDAKLEIKFPALLGIKASTVAALDPNQSTSSSIRYDLGGNIVASTDQMGHQSVAVYDRFNHKVGSRDAAGGLQSWEVDGHGRVLGHTDLAGSAIVYDYDAAGRLARQYTPASAQRQHLVYRYNDEGRLAQIHDGVLQQVSEYSYDQVGNRLSERVTLHGDGQGGRAAQDNTIRYDGQGRVREIVSGVAGADYRVVYGYDDNGNRTQVNTSYTDDNGQSKTIAVTNLFDKMNRQSGVSGTVQSRQPVPDAGEGGGGGASYRDASERIAEHSVVYDGAGNRVSDNIVSGGKTVKESYAYDAAGRLASVLRDGKEVGYRRYDGAGRAVESLDNDEVRVNDYDQAGRLERQRVLGNDARRSFKSDIIYASAMGKAADGSTSGGYDDAGNLLTYIVRDAKGELQTFVNGYNEAGHVSQGDGYQLTSTTVTGSEGRRARTDKWYDVNGHLVSVSSLGDKVDLKLVSDSGGRVLEKRDVKAGTLSHTLIANDQVLGSSQGQFETFSSDFDGMGSPALSAAPSNYVVQGAAETLHTIAAALWGDEKLWYVLAEANPDAAAASGPLPPGKTLAVPARVSTTHNDYATFKPYNAAEAVGDTTPQLPPPSHGGGCGGVGALIMIVVAVAATIYTAGAAASYFAGMSGAIGTGAGAAAAAGVTSAGGAFAAAGALAAGTTGLSIGAAMAAGAIGGAMGSIASQVVGMAVGAQDGFSWKGVAMAALGNAVTAGVGSLGASSQLGSALKGSDWTAVAARAAISNAATQGVGNITGLQHGFNWGSVAASYAGAAVGNQVAGYLDNQNIFGDLSPGAARFATAGISSFSAGLATAVMRGGKIAVAQIATDAFGNALGSSLAYNAQSSPSMPETMWNRAGGTGGATPEPFDDGAFNRIAQDEVANGERFASTAKDARNWTTVARGGQLSPNPDGPDYPSGVLDDGEAYTKQTYTEDGMSRPVVQTARGVYAYPLNSSLEDIPQVIVSGRDEREALLAADAMSAGAGSGLAIPDNGIPLRAPNSPRLPVSLGTWENPELPGNSGWNSSKPTVIAITGGAPVEFKNGYPNFEPWSQGRFNFKNLTGNNRTDFALAYQQIAKQQQLPSNNAAKQWLSNQNLTLHHNPNGVSFDLIPSNLHNSEPGIPHAGGASILRNWDYSRGGAWQEFTANRIATGGRYLGVAGMAYGAYADGSSLWGQYNASRQSGSYANTLDETARIAGGWGAAWAVGQAGAEFGGGFGFAVGGPVGGAIGGLLGGAIGGGIGYAGGSWAASGIFKSTH